MNEKDKAFVLKQIEFLKEKTAELSQYFNSDLDFIHCEFKSNGDEKRITISVLDENAFKQFLQTHVC